MASDDGDPSVLVNRSLPKEPRLFAMVHELKHHYCDQKLLKNGQIRCGDYNANELIEKAAEVFAAEFIYPSQKFLDCAESLGLKKGEVTPEEVVELKRACGAPISYKFLQKLPCVVWVYQPRRVCKGAVSEARRGDLRRSNIPPTVVQGAAAVAWLNLSGMDSRGHLGFGQARGG